MDVKMVGAHEPNSKEGATVVREMKYFDVNRN